MTNSPREQRSKPPEVRRQEIEAALVRAYEHVIVQAEVPLIDFGEVNGLQLAALYGRFPDIVGPTVACLDLDELKVHLHFDPIATSPLTESQATFLAGYTKAFLKERVPIQALVTRALYAENTPMKSGRRRGV